MMKESILLVMVIVLLVLVWNMTAYRDISELKEVAPSFIEERGFEITSYDGYSGNPIMGGWVWYQARDNEGYLYTMSVAEWRGHYHIYNLKCINAVTSSK